ncbi:MAG: hypothetical protein A2X35_00400 [Elusimicrobia bacterium GWA2_61_42]|nr:MAG: hypothetical protein A2X35_00400 [Elusimicrobia bacterium GWA2_61_42]OGR79188.1 MAG: hypothetical protein A2X38_06515 [Elusimicrobia bacterium GWC2_61_25]
MKRLLLLLPVLLLAAPSKAFAQSFSQLSQSPGAGDTQIPEPASAAAADESQAAGQYIDFLVRPPAEHAPGAKLFNPVDGRLKSAGRKAEEENSPYLEKAKAGQEAEDIPYLKEARAEAAAQGLDLALVLAVIQKESSFDPKARSAVGAVGLMQLMPDTARWLGLKDTSQLTKPAVNIKYGVKYLKFLWEKFSEAAPADISAEEMKTRTSQMAIAAYNAGQGNVRKYDGVPPFKETRYYVKKVTEYFSYYEGLLESLLE